MTERHRSGVTPFHFCISPLRLRISAILIRGIRVNSARFIGVKNNGSKLHSRPYQPNWISIQRQPRTSGRFNVENRQQRQFDWWIKLHFIRRRKATGWAVYQKFQAGGLMEGLAISAASFIPAIAYEIIQAIKNKEGLEEQSPLITLEILRSVHLNQCYHINTTYF